MTATETVELREMRNELHGYHTEVVKWAQKCTDCQEMVHRRFSKLETDTESVKADVIAITTRHRALKAGVTVLYYVTGSAATIFAFLKWAAKVI